MICLTIIGGRIHLFNIQLCFPDISAKKCLQSFTKGGREISFSEENQNMAAAQPSTSSSNTSEINVIQEMTDYYQSLVELFAKGVNFDLPGNGGPECLEYLSETQRIYETIFFPDGWLKTILHVCFNSCCRK